MHKTLKSTSPGMLLPIFLMLFLTGCGKASTPPAAIGVFSAVAPDSSSLAGTTVLPGIALELKNGYDIGLKGAKTNFTPININENAQQSDIQRTIRDLVQDPKTPLLAVLGATSNDDTSHAAALVNFFNVPMLVPSASGDNLFPSTNLWAFRLSAPSTAYANYMFGSVINKPFLDSTSLAANGAAGSGLKVAILYEENTFGESAAVATATAAMGQSIKVAVYGNFPPVNPDPASVENLVNSVKDNGVQLVYLVVSDPTLAKNLVLTFQSVFANQTMPILVGQTDGFASKDFLSSPQAEGVFVMRQKIDRTSCPATIQSSYDAQSFASVFLMDQAIQLARANLAAPAAPSVPALPTKLSLPGQTTPTILQQREAIRDALKVINIDLPCIGKVAFDTAGQNKLAQLEIISVKNGQTVTYQPVDFLNVIKSQLTRSIN